MEADQLAVVTRRHIGRSDAYQARLGELGFLASMSVKGNCYDNAVIETFFKTIKSELI